MASLPVASSTPILDLIVLDMQRSSLEKEKAEQEDRMKQCVHVEARHSKTISDLQARLRHHGSGMLREDQDAITNNIAAATVGLAEAQRGVKQHSAEVRSLTSALDEVKTASESVYTCLRREMVAAAPKDASGAAGKALRDGVFSIVQELTELLNTVSITVYNPRADDVPHYTSWEQRASASIRNATDKFTAAHRTILNALNRVAAGSPEITGCDALWATLVNDAATAFVAVAAKVVDDTLGEYRRVLEGGASVPLFGINVKLTANCKVVLAPAVTEIRKLLQPLIDKLFEMVQLPHFRTSTTVQAKSLATAGARPAAAGRRAATTAHRGPFSYIMDSETTAMDTALRQIPCLADHVKSIHTVCQNLDVRVADAIADIESKHGHLWSSSLPDMTLQQLEVSRRALDADVTLASGMPVLDAIYLNTFSLYDTVVSMIAQQETKARAVALAKQIEGFASMSKDTSLRQLRQVALAPIVPSEASSPLAPKKAAVCGAAPPKAPVLKITIAPAPAAVTTGTTTTTQASAAEPQPKQQPQQQSQPKQSAAPVVPIVVSSPATEPRAKSEESPRNASAAQTSAAPPKQAAPQHLSATDVEFVEVTPRPSTTPVGTRQRPSALGSRPSNTAAAPSATSTTRESPGTPNPKAGTRTSVTATSEAAATDSNANPASSNSNRAPPPPNAWDSPKQERQATVPDAPQSPASQARTNSTLHMSSTPERTTAMADMDRLVQKERESMDRLRQLRLQAERRALMQTGEAPTPQEVLQQQQTTPTTLTPLRGTPRGPTPTTATEAGLDDAEARRQARASTLQNQRLQREREMLLEAHRAQEKRRAEDKARAEQELGMRMKQEQQRRADELARDREAEERRREAAEADRAKREAQRKIDEEREAQLRTRLDELERRREVDRKRFAEEKARSASTSSAASSPPQADRNSSGATAGAPALPAVPQSSSNGSSGALRKKLNLPGDATGSAPSSARGNTPSSSTATGATDLPPVGSARGRQPQPPPSAAASAPAAQDTAPQQQQQPQRLAPTPVAVAPSPQLVPPPSATPNGGGAGGVLSPTDIPYIETEGKSHLDVYRAYCQALNIKPNSGLLKTLPSEVGRHCSSINLDLNYIGVRGVRPLIEILRINRGLTLLNLKDNNLENAEIRQLVNVLLGEPGASLTHLDLSNNPISLAGGSAIMDLVARQPTLKTVVLKGTLIQAKVVEKIVDAAARNVGA